MSTLTDVSRFFDAQLGFGKEVVRGTAVAIDSFISAKTAKPKLARQRIDAQGSDGNAVREVTDDIGGAETYSADIMFPVRPLAYFEEILECITGGTPSGSGVITYPLANLVKSLTLEIGTGQDFETMAGAIAATGEFASEVNSVLMLTMAMLSETLSSSLTGATNAVDLVKRPFIHTDVVLLIDGVPLPISMFKWGWDRSVEVFHANDIAPCELIEKRHMITGEFGLVWSEEAKAVLDRHVADTPMAVKATYTSGSDVLTFEFPDVFIDDQDWPGISDVEIDEYTTPFQANRDDTAGTDAVIISMTDQP